MRKLGSALLVGVSFLGVAPVMAWAQTPKQCEDQILSWSVPKSYKDKFGKKKTEADQHLQPEFGEFCKNPPSDAVVRCVAQSYQFWWAETSPAQLSSVMSSCTSNPGSVGAGDYIGPDQCRNEMIFQKKIDPKVAGDFCGRKLTLDQYSCLSSVAYPSVAEATQDTMYFCLQHPKDGAKCYRDRRNQEKLSPVDAITVCSSSDPKVLSCLQQLKTRNNVVQEGNATLCSMNSSQDAQDCMVELRDKLPLTGAAAASICGTNPSKDARSCAANLHNTRAKESAIVILCSVNPSADAQDCLKKVANSQPNAPSMDAAALACAKNTSVAEVNALQKIFGGKNGGCLDDGHAGPRSDDAVGENGSGDNVSGSADLKGEQKP